MGTIVQGLLLILLVLSVVAAFLGARTWHWGHVLVVLGIFLSTLGFFILAAETVRINQVLRTRVKQREQDLAKVNARNEALEKGTDNASIIGELTSEDPPVRLLEGAETIPSIADLDHQLLLATRLRGRVWRKVAPTGIDPQTGAVTVTIDSPAPTGLKPNENEETVVYVFEEGAARVARRRRHAARCAQYLGEFRVIEAAGQQARLLPVLPFDQFEQRRLAASRGPWAIYEMMPPDRHAIFAGMSEEDLKKSLPRQSVEEYLRHGKDAVPDDPPERVVGFDADGKRLPPDQVDQAAKKVYQRRLRDYATEFDVLSRRRRRAGSRHRRREEGHRTPHRRARQRQGVASLPDLREAAAGRRPRQASRPSACKSSSTSPWSSSNWPGPARCWPKRCGKNDELAEELAARHSPPASVPNGAQSPTRQTAPLVLGTVN